MASKFTDEEFSTKVLQFNHAVSVYISTFVSAVPKYSLFFVPGVAQLVFMILTSFNYIFYCILSTDWNRLGS